MLELLLILGAAALFCVLVFGSAWLAAAWMNTSPSRWKRPGRQRRRRRHKGL